MSKRLPVKLSLKLATYLGGPQMLRNPVANRNPDKHLEPVATRGSPQPVGMARQGQNLWLAFSLPANLGTGPRADEPRPVAGIPGTPHPT